MAVTKPDQYRIDIMQVGMRGRVRATVWDGKGEYVGETQACESEERAREAAAGVVRRAERQAGLRKLAIQVMKPKPKRISKNGSKPIVS